jgi:hypothetical protein
VLVDQFGEDWTAYPPAVTFAYNSSVTESIGYAPFALMYGRAHETQLMKCIKKLYPVPPHA